ncbi:MAG: hypothetical protein A2W62_00145 [Alphaproteobacteria bacterium RIFCSPLOWO2_02_42_7]|nr:MAG: hypothetical protein A2W62_00145 [Alphaproteobacteria bacterium RIFCSPLOWO2_02_42_7]
MFALGSIKFGDFWWTYHKNYPEAPLAPMYFDIRMVRRNQIIRGRPVDILQNAVNGLEFHLIADIPTAMTPTVTLLAERLGLGMVSPRKEAKDKGSGEMVDGFLREDKGATAVLIDDVLARGDSKLIYAENLKKAGGFIPGYRPGQNTASYLDTVITRLTVMGAAYLAFVCAVPEFFYAAYSLPFYLGGTTFLIAVSVPMDTVAQIHSHLLAHQYEGLLKKTQLRGTRR